MLPGSPFLIYKHTEGLGTLSQCGGADVEMLPDHQQGGAGAMSVPSRGLMIRAFISYLPR